MKFAGMCGLLTVLLIAFAARHAQASDNRFQIVDQLDFGAKRGFYLGLENWAPGDTPSKLDTLKLIWGVGDGKDLHFLAPPAGGWRFDHDYVVRATVGPKGAQLILDGKIVAEDAGQMTPVNGPLLAGAIPGWAHGPADYWIALSELHVTPQSGKPLAFTFPALSPTLMLFEPQAPQRVENWTVGPGRSLTVEATFHLSHPPSDLALLAPLIDSYGQVAGAAWPGKTTQASDLQRDMADEDRRLQSWSATAQREYDAYGGWRKAGWRGARSGVFRTVQHQGVWWLLSPDGNPCFYTGVSTIPALEWERTPVTGREKIFDRLPPHEGAMAAAWGGDSWGKDPGTQSVSFAAANLIRKYGSDWRAVFQRRSVRRVKAWGFTGFGKWSDIRSDAPSLPVLNRSGVPILAGHPDPFDPEIQAKLRTSLADQITPHRHDPTIVAWSLGNEYDELIKSDEVRQILAMGAQVPAKRALTDRAVSTLYAGDAARLAIAWGIAGSTGDTRYGAATLRVPDADVEALRRFYEDRYFDLAFRTVKSLDPQHLYAGFWIVPGWWENEEDWRIITRHCDLIGYDNYGFQFADERLNRLIRASGKPVLCGEFSFPPQYAGGRGFGHYDAAWATDEADAGRLYTRYAETAARSPNCVGVSWFQYRDEPASGRGPGHGPDAAYGEHYAFGLVDIADRPKWTLLQPMRRANLAVPAIHASLKTPNKTPTGTINRQNPTQN